MKNSCVITAILEDDDKFLEYLVKEASSTFDTVQILALGNDSDVLVLKERFTDVITLNDLTSEFTASRIIVTTLDAFLELDSYILKFGEITLWFDPNLTSDSNISDLINCTCANTLARLLPGAIASTNENGSATWHSYTNQTVPSIQRERSCELEPGKVDALIEKSNKTRFLIDGSSNISNHYMVDAFIALQKIEDVEIWCLFDGELKSWMRPDFLIAGVDREDISIYVESVDVVVLVGDSVKETQFIDYIQLGKMPVSLDGTVSKRLHEILDPNLLKQVSNHVGTAEIISELAHDKSKVAEYNKLSTEAELTSNYFRFSDIEDIFADSNALLDYFNVPVSSLTRSEYLEARYGDKEGSELHRNAKLNARIVGEVIADRQNKIRVSGWALNIEDDSLCIPLVIRGRDQLKGLVRRHSRADVLSHFKKSGIDNVGFVAKFYHDIDEAVDLPITYAITDSNNGYAPANTMLEDLNLSVEEGLLQELGYHHSSGPNGCVETLSFETVLRFELNNLTRDIQEYDFRLQKNGTFLSMDMVDISFVVENEIRNEEVIKEDYSFKYMSSMGVQKKVQIIVAVTGGLSDLDNVSCIVSHEDSQIILSESVSEYEDMDEESVIDTNEEDQQDEVNPELEQQKVA